MAGRLQPCYTYQVSRKWSRASDGAAVLFFSALIAALQGVLAFEFAQGVIVDPARSLVYVMSPKGGIDAVALSGGAVLATTMRAAKPLLLYDDTLLAQAEGKDGVLSLVGLKANDLDPAFTVDVPLPSGVQALVSLRLGATFYASARKDGDVITVQWRSVQRRISGVPTREPGHVSTGFARIDARNERLIASGEGEPPGSAKDTILGSSAERLSPHCASDDGATAIQYDRDQVTLRRWNKDGESLSDIPLFGSELTFRTFSRDCRHLLASKAENGWSWYIYSVATGKRLTEVHSSRPGAEFFVWDDSLIYEAAAEGKLVSGQFAMVEPHRLQAIDFTGKELWTRPIREITYRGPYPSTNMDPVRGQRE